MAVEVLPSLIKALGDEEESYVREVAARLLGEIGPDAESAVPALEKATKDESDEVREAATEALKRIQR
jgi:HEAT repeat protein